MIREIDSQGGGPIEVPCKSKVDCEDKHMFIWAAKRKWSCFRRNSWFMENTEGKRSLRPCGTGVVSKPHRLVASVASVSTFIPSKPIIRHEKEMRNLFRRGVLQEWADPDKDVESQ